MPCRPCLAGVRVQGLWSLRGSRSLGATCPYVPRDSGWGRHTASLVRPCILPIPLQASPHQMLFLSASLGGTLYPSGADTDKTRGHFDRIIAPHQTGSETSASPRVCETILSVQPFRGWGIAYHQPPTWGGAPSEKAPPWLRWGQNPWVLRVLSIPMTFYFL